MTGFRPVLLMSAGLFYLAKAHMVISDKPWSRFSKSEREEPLDWCVAIRACRILGGMTWKWKE